MLAALLLASCYLAPVPVPVALPFAAPACEYCPGHRGLAYELPAGSPVQAAAPGTVTFAGVVAGTRYVVIDGDDGVVATYGMLAQADVGRGDRVSEGESVGRSSAQLYFGLRIDGRYVDPAPFLGRPSWRPRLVPPDGSRPRPARPGLTRCANEITRGGRRRGDVSSPG